MKNCNFIKKMKTEGKNMNSLFIYIYISFHTVSNSKLIMLKDIKGDEMESASKNGSTVSLLLCAAY